VNALAAEEEVVEMSKRSNVIIMLTLLSLAVPAIGQINGGPPPTDRQQQPPPPPPPPPPEPGPGPDNRGLPPVPVPAENPITEAKRVLGKILFWDEQLSSDNSMACGTCHIPAFSGADPNLATHPGFDETFGTFDDIIGSPGVVRRDNDGTAIDDPLFGFDRQVTGRAAPSYFATMFSPETFWDGRATSRFTDPVDGVTTIIAEGGALESQAVGPLLSSAEMAKDGRTWTDVTNKLNASAPLALASDLPPDVADALATQANYPDLFADAFGDGAITPARIALAIATYERTLVADETPWDQFVAGNANALTQQQREGWDLLRDHTRCLRCHRPPLFTDNNFHNIGLRPSFEDQGRMVVTGNQRDTGRFKTPSLRNVGLKPSMMHVGWVTDVNDAIDFYNSGRDNDTRHMQFIRDQSGVPTGTPGEFDDNSEIFVPDRTPDGRPFRAAVIDFLENGLTDPRVANEAFPFDRPTLASERTVGNDVPIIRVTPTSLDFGDVPIGESATLSLVVTNIGQGILTGSANARGPFSISGPAGYSLANGESTIIDIVFQPQNDRAYANVIDFQGNAETSASVTGEGESNTAGNIDGIGDVDAVDIQLVINKALGLDIGIFNGDVNNDGAIDAVDVQLVINTALGL
jgi:cytochrome c peroxidase